MLTIFICLVTLLVVIAIAAELSFTISSAIANTEEDKLKRFLKFAEILGLWAAAIVGATAIIVGTIDASEQREIMMGQLKEAQAQRQIIISQARARFLGHPPVMTLAKAADGTNIGWSVSPVFTNIGSTEANDFQPFWEIGHALRWIPEPHGEDCPKIGAQALTSTPITVSPLSQQMLSTHMLPQAVVDLAIKQEATIFLAGFLQYRDVFSPEFLHRYKWCVAAYPIGLPNQAWSFVNVISELDPGA